MNKKYSILIMTLLFVGSTELAMAMEGKSTRPTKFTPKLETIHEQKEYKEYRDLQNTHLQENVHQPKPAEIAAIEAQAIKDNNAVNSSLEKIKTKSPNLPTQLQYEKLLENYRNLPNEQYTQSVKNREGIVQKRLNESQQSPGLDLNSDQQSIVREFMLEPSKRTMNLQEEIDALTDEQKKNVEKAIFQERQAAIPDAIKLNKTRSSIELDLNQKEQTAKPANISTEQQPITITSKHGLQIKINNPEVMTIENQQVLANFDSTLTNNKNNTITYYSHVKDSLQMNGSVTIDQAGNIVESSGPQSSPKPDIKFNQQEPKTSSQLPVDQKQTTAKQLESINLSKSSKSPQENLQTIKIEDLSEAGKAFAQYCAEKIKAILDNDKIPLLEKQSILAQKQPQYIFHMDQPQYVAYISNVYRNGQDPAATRYVDKLYKDAFQSIKNQLERTPGFIEAKNKISAIIENNEQQEAINQELAKLVIQNNEDPYIDYLISQYTYKNDATKQSLQELRKQNNSINLILKDSLRDNTPKKKKIALEESRNKTTNMTEDIDNLYLDAFTKITNLRIEELQAQKERSWQNYKNAQTFRESIKTFTTFASTSLSLFVQQGSLTAKSIRSTITNLFKQSGAQVSRQKINSVVDTAIATKPGASATPEQKATWIAATTQNVLDAEINDLMSGNDVESIPQKPGQANLQSNKSRIRQSISDASQKVTQAFSRSNNQESKQEFSEKDFNYEGNPINPNYPTTPDEIRL